MKKEIIPSYLCDFERVNDCPKTECQQNCFRTLIKDRAKLDEEGKPIITGYVEKCL